MIALKRIKGTFVPSACGFMALLIFIYAGGTVVLAQTPGAGSEGENRTLTARDGWQVHVTYFASTRGKESPIVILLPGVEGHAKSMTRKVWNGVATNLQKDGYAVVTADLRKHGDSMPAGSDGNPTEKQLRLTTSDYVAMASQDLEAIKAFLMEEHQKERLNIRKLGIASAGSSCLVAAGFTAADWAKKPWPDAATLAMRTPKGQDVRALLMLSPVARVKGINTTMVMRSIADTYKGIAVHIYFNPTQETEKADAEKLYRFLRLKSDPTNARVMHEGPPGENFSAERALQGRAKMKMEQNIRQFFDTFVKKREDPWRTRTSRL